MTKEEIQKTIYSLKNENEIIDFVKRRIQELENNSVESTVGQNYTKTFKEYISEKTHYKVGDKFSDAECPDLVYDDLTPYINLVKSLRQSPRYNEFLLYTKIFFEIRDYLPNNDQGQIERAITYGFNKGGRVSIKDIQKNKCGVCAERAGLAHNLFKFLGTDSEVAGGYRNSELHAYNLVYPNGYEKEPIVIYDPSFSIAFSKNGQRFANAGYFQELQKADYDKLMSGISVKIDLTETEKKYRQAANLGNDISVEGDTPTYTVGLEKSKEDIVERI